MTTKTKSSKPIKVRRSGFHRIFIKREFRAWLDEQIKSDLTYDPALKLDHSKGWTYENFVREAWHRGLDVRIGTMMRWTSGAKPRPFMLHELKKHFKTIRF